MTEAERYRIIYEMITNPKDEGGAGITPKEGEWKDVESIFPLHDITHNREWVKDWSMKTFLKIEDLDEIRNRFGEKVTNVLDRMFRTTNRKTDRLLLCVHPILLYVPNLSCCFWLFGLGPSWPLLTYLRHGKHVLVCHVCRVLEASGVELGYTLGCERCLCCPRQKKRF